VGEAPGQGGQEAGWTVPEGWQAQARGGRHSSPPELDEETYVRRRDQLLDHEHARQREAIENRHEAATALTEMLGVAQEARRALLSVISGDPDSGPEAKARYEELSAALTAAEDAELKPFSLQDGQLFQARPIEHNGHRLLEVRRFMVAGYGAQQEVVVASATGDPDSIHELTDSLRAASPSEAQPVSGGIALDVGNAALRYSDYLRTLADMPAATVEKALTARIPE
jgi:hypothetical protein